jgi:lipocalin
MILITIFFSLFTLLSSKNIPNTVTSFNLDSYLGHWINIYASPTNFIFQGYGKCLTADYGVLDNGNISVINKQLDKNNNSEVISGYAYYKNKSEPGKLNVHFDGVPVDGPYWIVQLGEIIDNQYQYSIVTAPFGISLWVLVRDLDVYYKYYDDEVKKFLDDYEFEYITISQDSC